MYIREAVADLVESMVALSGPGTDVLVAHGRNRFAEGDFLACCARRGLAVAEVPGGELDEVYQCSDVAVYRLARRRGGG
jgi:hypothetical protein